MCSEIDVNVKVQNLLSIDECYKILNEEHSVTNNFQIVNRELEILGGHPGFLGNYIKLRIKTSDGITHHYFIKSKPLENEPLKEVINELGVFQKEIGVYSKVFTKFAKNIGDFKWRPNVYLVRDDLLVMEDLVTQDYKQLPFKFELTKFHIELVLSSLSRLHASSINCEVNVFKGQRLDEIFKEFLYDPAVDRKNNFFAAGLRGIKAVALNATKYAKHSIYKKLMEDKLDQEIDKIYDLFRPHYDRQNVVIHRDIWVNNVLFKLENGDLNMPKHAIILDYQICSYMPLEVDVLCAIYFLTRKWNRDKYYDNYIKFYYNNLKDELAKFGHNIEHFLKWEKYLENLEYFKLVPHIINSMYIELTNLPAGVLDHLNKTDLDDYYHVLEVDRSDFILKHLPLDKYYHETLIEAVEETVEFIFKINQSKNVAI